jgi:hypothetical protein
MDWETLYTEIKKLNWQVLLILSLLSYFLMSASLTFGVILGGFIIMANFHVFQHSIRRAFCPERLVITTKISVIVKYYFRLLGLGIIFYALIPRGWVHPVGLAVGLSTVVISIISLAIKRALGSYPTEVA